jgi:hypothetical protein
VSIYCQPRTQAKLTPSEASPRLGSSMGRKRH